MAHVRVLSTGGTIASTDDGSGEAGKTPGVSGEELLEAVPEIGAHASVDVEEVCRVSGFQMTVERANAILDAAERADADGVDGVVVTHGTDTMAESAFYAALVRPADVPIAFTGSQRPFDELGTDGPSNLVAAVRAATDGRFADRWGSYLAFDDEVHAARWVEKTHTTDLGTFRSPDTGPVAELTPDGFRFLREPGSYGPALPGERIDPDVRVEIVTNALGVDGGQVERALEAGVDAIVVAGTGLGNATGELGAALEDALGAGVPVVLTSRCHAGTTAGLYGGPGGGKTLLDAGAISGGDLPAWKARVTAALALSAGADLEAAFDGIDTVA